MTQETPCHPAVASLRANIGCVSSALMGANGQGDRVTLHKNQGDRVTLHGKADLRAKGTAGPGAFRVHGQSNNDFKEPHENIAGTRSNGKRRIAGLSAFLSRVARHCRDETVAAGPAGADGRRGDGRAGRPPAVAIETWGSGSGSRTPTGSRSGARTDPRRSGRRGRRSPREPGSPSSSTTTGPRPRRNRDGRAHAGHWNRAGGAGRPMRVSSSGRGGRWRRSRLYVCAAARDPAASRAVLLRAGDQRRQAAGCSARSRATRGRTT